MYGCVEDNQLYPAQYVSFSLLA